MVHRYSKEYFEAEFGFEGHTETMGRRVDKTPAFMVFNIEEGESEECGMVCEECGQDDCAEKED